MNLFKKFENFLYEKFFPDKKNKKSNRFCSSCPPSKKPTEVLFSNLSPLQNKVEPSDTELLEEIQYANTHFDARSIRIKTLYAIYQRNDYVRENADEISDNTRNLLAKFAYFILDLIEEIDENIEKLAGDGKEKIQVELWSGWDSSDFCEEDETRFLGRLGYHLTLAVSRHIKNKSGKIFCFDSKEQHIIFIKALGAFLRTYYEELGYDTSFEKRYDSSWNINIMWGDDLFMEKANKVWDESQILAYLRGISLEDLVA